MAGSATRSRMRYPLLPWVWDVSLKAIGFWKMFNALPKARQEPEGGGGARQGGAPQHPSDCAQAESARPCGGTALKSGLQKYRTVASWRGPGNRPAPIVRGDRSLTPVSV